MMASRKVDLRLVKRKREAKTSIDSPLARYNSAGQLSCVVCDMTIKNEFLWTSHVLGKKHKENLADLKGKSKANVSVREVRKPVKVSGKVETNEEAPKKKLKVDNSSDANSFTDSLEEIKDEISTDEQAGLPSDFFDHEIKSEMQQHIASGDSTEGIPEGFFDDPKLDAKVRKVEYKDQAEEQWEKFQKEMQVENQVSQSIVEGEDEESRVNRELSELSEQRVYFLRADALRDKQSSLKDKFSNLKSLQPQPQRETTSDSDDSDFDEFLDWRAKKVS
ncbi:zinc finger protein 830-like isoform X1 [Pocillopora damicornis]|uniref:zinc finger protein 830-like isoform X1 n=1 Tax=Pocillopora damicornis TaxID=46731 RepID=UPI000F54CE86|nr:zinc finger protein 830-like isoform X1 [Pocillopora damicornis]